MQRDVRPDPAPVRFHSSGRTHGRRFPGARPLSHRLFRGPEPRTPSGPGALRPILSGSILAGLCLLGSLLSSGCGGSEDVPWDRSGFQKLDLALQPLRKDFEDHYGQIRVVAVLAPTCGNCVQNADRLYNSVRPWAEEHDAEIFMIWGSVLPPDTELRCSQRVEEFPSPRIHHYWDDSGRTTRAFGRMLDLPRNGDAYDVFFAYGPEATWDPNDTMETEPKDFSVALSLWEPTRPDLAALSGNLNRISLPAFSGAEMVRLLDEAKRSMR